jgi:replicative DNA helicase
MLEAHSSPIPHHPEAEQALLGALLLNNSLLEEIGDYLRPDHFSNLLHGKIYHAILTLVNKGHVADPITLKNLIKDQEGSSEDYLMQLAEATISLVNAREYGHLIYDLYLRRQLITIGDTLLQDVRRYDLESSALAHIESTERKLYDLAVHGHNQGGLQAFSQALTEAIKSAEVAFKRDSHVVGVTSGFLDLDKWLGGLHPSDLLILAGRPSMGKTALATNIAFNATKAYMAQKGEGAPVAFFSLEMSAEQLASRILASEAGISSDKIRRGEIRADDFPKFVEISRQLTQLPLYIDDTPALSVTALRNRARRLQRQQGLGLIVVDYLQLLNPGHATYKGDGRVQEISDITRSLKALAKELNVPVLALSQLSRAVEQRDDKRPQLSDLRESGSIEQDADVVMFVFREAYYKTRKEPAPGSEQHKTWQEEMSQIYNLAEVIIAKQRHGPTGTVKLFFEGALTKFGNFSEASSPV